MAKKKPTGNTKRYLNQGVSRLVLEGVSILPGDEFEALLHPEHEQQLIAGGHISILRDVSPETERRQADELAQQEIRAKAAANDNGDDS